MEAMCVSNKCKCGCGFIAPIQVGDIHEIETFSKDENFVVVIGVTPYVDNEVGLIEALSKDLFAPLSEKEESSLKHWEKFPESITTLIEIPC